MKASWYAEALYGALEGKSESDGSQVLARFRAVLAARGHSAVLRFIPQELGKIIEREKNKNEVILVTADSKSLSKWAHAYDHYEKEDYPQARDTTRCHRRIYRGRIPDSSG